MSEEDDAIFSNQEIDYFGRFLNGDRNTNIRSLYDLLNLNDEQIFAGTTLKACDLAGQQDFAHFSFERANLSSSDLSGSDFSNCNFKHAKLRRAKVSGAIFDGASFDFADMFGVVGTPRSAKGITATNTKNSPHWVRNALGTSTEYPPPRVLVGSSRESAKFAAELADPLGPEIVANVWQNLLGPSDNVLDNLLLFSSLYEFGIFVLSPDDQTTSRGAKVWELRDNVIFELGVFMGTVGWSRAFAVAVERGDTKVKLPSDLAGGVYLPVRLGTEADKEAAATVIRSRILELAKTAPPSLLPGTSLAVGYYQNFLLPIGRLLQDVGELEVGSEKLDLDRRRYDLTVVMPSKLSNAGVADRDFIRENRLRAASVPPQILGRSRRTYDFYVGEGPEDGPIQIFDYATPLRAAHEAIRFVLGIRAYGDRQKEYDILAARELRMFAQALRLMQAEPDGRVFPNGLKFRYI